MFPSGDRESEKGETSGTSERLYFYVEKVYVYVITIGTPLARLALAEEAPREQ